MKTGDKKISLSRQRQLAAHAAGRREEAEKMVSLLEANLKSVQAALAQARAEVVSAKSAEIKLLSFFDGDDDE